MGIKSEVKKFMDEAYTVANGPKDVSITLPAKYLRKHLSEAEINDLIDVCAGPRRDDEASSCAALRKMTRAEEEGSSQGICPRAGLASPESRLVIGFENVV